MKIAGLLVFLLFPVLTFAQITWEKEGLQTLNYLKKKMNQSKVPKDTAPLKTTEKEDPSEAPESKVTREEYVNKLCREIGTFSLGDYKKILDNLFRLDEKYQLLFVKAINSKERFYPDEEDDFMEKCNLHFYLEEIKNAHPTNMPASHGIPSWALENNDY